MLFLDKAREVAEVAFVRARSHSGRLRLWLFLPSSSPLPFFSVSSPALPPQAPQVAEVAFVRARSHSGRVNPSRWRSCELARILGDGVRASPLAF